MISATCSEDIGKFHLICTQRGPVLCPSNGVSFIWIMTSYIRLSLQSPNKRWDFRWYQCDTPRNKCFPGNIEIFCITYQLKTRSTQERKPPPRLIGGMWNNLANREAIYPQMFQDVPCSMLNLSWKFHQNPFTCFSVMLLTDRKKTDKPKGGKHNLQKFGR